MHTETANTGEAALEKLTTGVFDCMILDLGLPDMTGFELLKTLEENGEVVIPPVIVYTGRELSREEVMELGKHAKSIIIKGVHSDARLLDESSLFLHRVIDNLPHEKRRMVTNLHDVDNVFRGKKVLIVDDDMRNLFALTKILEEKGVCTLKAENGQKAIALLKSEGDVELVLMDIMMPVMDGFEAMTRLRTMPEFHNLPIIALTAKAMKKDHESCLAAGASDYLSKPVDINRLFSMMRVWLYR